jgi:hypothetical protein
MEITYFKLKSGPISLLQGRPMITGKHMPGAEFLVSGVFFLIHRQHFTSVTTNLLYSIFHCWDVQKKKSEFYLR